jgi:hypothetical protein
MTDRVRLLGALLLTLFLSGCGSTPPPEPTPTPEANTTPTFVPFNLTAPIEISLEDLLKKPRKELAELGDEWARKVDFQEQQYRKGEARFEFLPSVRLPLAVPVWRQARFDAALGLSVPPYYSGGKDADLALHLARHGDADGALKLADPADARTRGQIESLRLNRNYPVEWTRLVALMLHEGQFRLAVADQHGARQFIMLHRQLQSLFDAKAKASALGTALWSRGKGVLFQAEDVWRKTKDVAVADQAKSLLASWGEGSWSEPALRPGIARDEVERILQGKAKGQVLNSPTTLRALDLLALPVPDQALEGVTCVFDPDGTLRELLLSYQSRLPERIPYPAQLAALLEENDAFRTADLPEAGNTRRRVYQRGDAQIQVEMIPENPVLGALIRLPLAGKAPNAPLPRAFGDVSLDRSFEQNRLRVALKQHKSPLEVKQAHVLQRIDQPLKQAEVRLGEASLAQSQKAELLQSIALTYTYPKLPLPFHLLVEPLWALAGSAEIQNVREGGAGQLTLTWEDGKTRYVLRLPHRRERSPELVVSDLTPAAELAKRAETVRGKDLAERRERFVQKNTFAFVPRELEKVRLGMTEAAFLKVLPREKDTMRRKIDGGWAVTFLKLSKKSPYVARDLAARFDASGRLAEVRVAYTNLPDSQGVDALTDEWRKQAGAPEVTKPGPATAAWFDLPGSTPTVLNRWHDDTTVATCQVDSSGAVATLRDCPVDQADGVPLPRFSVLPRGPGEVSLGMTRDEVIKKAGAKNAKEVDDFLVLAPRERDEYDVVLVRFDNDRVARILARHAFKTKAQPAQMHELLRKAWGRSFRELGWQSREYTAGEMNLPGWATSDERTRCRIFWEQDAGDNLRLLTEWKELP